MANKSLIIRLILVASMIALTACTPPDVEYCRGFGVDPGTAEYPACMQYYHTQEALFSADYSACSAQADPIYPPTLYDHWHTELVQGYDPYRGFSHFESVDVPPDARHNAEVDALRMRIIGPCMDARGWNSPTNWQAGKHKVKPRPIAAPAPSPATADPLPWLKH